MSTSTTGTDQHSSEAAKKPRSGLLSRGNVLFALGVLVVLVAYVIALIGLDTPASEGGTSNSLSNVGVAFGVLAMFMTLCAFVLAFIKAANSDKF